MIENAWVLAPSLSFCSADCGQGSEQVHQRRGQNVRVQRLLHALHDHTPAEPAPKSREPGKGDHLLFMRDRTHLLLKNNAASWQKTQRTQLQHIDGAEGLSTSLPREVT